MKKGVETTSALSRRHLKLLLGKIPWLRIYLGKCNFVLAGEGLALAGVHLPEVLQVHLVTQQNHLPEVGREVWRVVGMRSIGGSADRIRWSEIELLFKVKVPRQIMLL